MIVYKKVNDPEFERLLNEGTKESFNELREWLIFEENRIAKERKRMEYDEQFFDKKMAILKSGYEQLEIDKKRLERDRINFNAEKNAHEKYASHIVYEDMAGTLFAGVNSFLALKKRYRDLLKIFHPDNMCGDHEMVSLITREYDRLKAEFDSPFRSVN